MGILIPQLEEMGHWPGNFILREALTVPFAPCSLGRRIEPAEDCEIPLETFVRLGWGRRAQAMDPLVRDRARHSSGVGNVESRSNKTTTCKHYGGQTRAHTLENRLGTEFVFNFSFADERLIPYSG